MKVFYRTSWLVYNSWSFAIVLGTANPAWSVNPSWIGFIVYEAETLKPPFPKTTVAEICYDEILTIYFLFFFSITAPTAPRPSCGKFVYPEAAYITLE